MIRWNNQQPEKLFVYEYPAQEVLGSGDGL